MAALGQPFRQLLPGGEDFLRLPKAPGNGPQPVLIQDFISQKGKRPCHPNHLMGVGQQHRCEIQGDEKAAGVLQMKQPPGKKLGKLPLLPRGKGKGDGFGYSALRLQPAGKGGGGERRLLSKGDKCLRCHNLHLFLLPSRGGIRAAVSIATQLRATRRCRK